jgi:hypothetical protein
LINLCEERVGVQPYAPPLGFLVGKGVGVLVWYLGVHFFSIAERMDTGSAPDRNIIIASRATSIHTAQP